MIPTDLFIVNAWGKDMHVYESFTSTLRWPLEIHSRLLAPQISAYDDKVPAKQVLSNFIKYKADSYNVYPTSLSLSTHLPYTVMKLSGIEASDILSSF